MSDEAALPAPPPAIPSREARLAIRCGAHRGHTAGIAHGYVQANLVVLPAVDAADFQTFCLLNPRPCPLLAVGERGSPHLPTLGADIDLRTDLPGYRVFRNGEEVDSPEEIARYWKEDFVAFALGCSFSFEEALMEAGIPLRHIERRECVPMYTTSVNCRPAGRFHGKLVVSMRPMRPADAIRAVQITSRFPDVHGAPIHIGLPEAIGIRDLEVPEYGGDPPRMQADEIPVFWACGVTPQAVIREVRPEFCITHRPGHMLVTDRRNAELAVM